MSKKQEFINYIESVINYDDMSENVRQYWEALKGSKEDNKPTFTDNGKMIMKYLQSLPTGGPMLKARDIAEGLFVSSRAVSGAMRKLCDDGFVEKAGQEPVVYALTEKGKNIEIDGENE